MIRFFKWGIEIEPYTGLVLAFLTAILCIALGCNSADYIKRKNDRADLLLQQCLKDKYYCNVRIKTE